jgi:catechol 2,3-dioxygenase-like lactoylglutathione lyase family enzyme
MLHHVSVGVHNLERAARFYDPVLKALGYKRVADYSPHAIAYGASKDQWQFWIQLPHDKGPASAGNGTHIAFIARSKAAVEKFHAAALANGGSNNGEPGPRPDYGPSYYGAFIYDLDGNKIEATLLTAPAVAKPAKRTVTKKAKKTKRIAAKVTRKTTKKAATPKKARRR